MERQGRHFASRRYHATLAVSRRQDANVTDEMEYQVILNQADTEEEKQTANAACGRYWKEAVREVYIREEYKRYRVFRTDQQSPRNIGPDSAGRKMVDMSEIYKNKKKRHWSGDPETWLPAWV